MIRFVLAKLMGDEKTLSRYALARPDLMDMLTGKRVAIVGNARALAATKQGAQIDNADIVIRINGAPIPDQVSHGSRTDWIAMSTPVAADIVAARGALVLLWMTRKRRRIPWTLVKTYTFFINAKAMSDRLIAKMGARPTTGLMLIDLLAQSNARDVHLHGFDFFASLSLSGARTQTQVPHDFPSEKALVTELLAADPRFHLHPMTE